jgi:ankyrin repeat protein
MDPLYTGVAVSKGSGRGTKYREIPQKDGSVLARTRLGPVVYTPAKPLAVQQLGLAMVKPTLTRLPPAMGAKVPLAEQQFIARMDTVCRELQRRGASTHIKGTEDLGRWARLTALEGRLASIREREVRQARAAALNTADKRQDAMVAYRVQRGAKRLIDACKDCKCQEMLDAIDCGAPATWRLNNGETLLTLVAHLRARQYVQPLISRGADPQMANADGWTPLMLAICEGSELFVEQLLDAKVNPNYGRWFGAGGGAAAGAPPPNADTSVAGFRSAWSLTPSPEGPKGLKPLPGREYLTPLMYACALGHGPIVRLLLSARANTRQQNNKGRTAIMYAVRYRRQECVRALCSERVDVLPQDRCGFNALDWLRASIREKLVALGCGMAVVGDEEGKVGDGEVKANSMDALLGNALGLMSMGKKAKRSILSRDHVGGAVDATLGRLRYSLVETNILRALEDANARYAAHTTSLAKKILRQLGAAVTEKKLSEKHGGGGKRAGEVCSRILGLIVSAGEAQAAERGGGNALLTSVTGILSRQAAAAGGAGNTRGLVSLLAGSEAFKGALQRNELMDSTSDEVDETLESKDMCNVRDVDFELKLPPRPPEVTADLESRAKEASALARAMGGGVSEAASAAAGVEDDMSWLPRATLVEALTTLNPKRLPRSKVVPDLLDFPTMAVLSEKPNKKRLPITLLAAQERLAGGKRDSLADPSDPKILEGEMVKRSVGGAATILKTLGIGMSTSKSTGQPFAVVPADKALMKGGKGSMVPLMLGHSQGMVARGFQPMTGLPMAVRERNAVTALVESAMTPILSLLPVRDQFNFLSPEQEAYEDFKNVQDPVTRQSSLLMGMRGALILYHKQTLERLGELAAPIVQMDMQSITPDDIGEFKSPTDPCDHCQSRRAVVHCINCAAAHCERCTLWLHKQVGFKHHRCKPILPKGMSEGLLMTRQVRRMEAARLDNLRLNSFHGFVERLRRVVRRVKNRVAAAAEARYAADAAKSEVYAAALVMAQTLEKNKQLKEEAQSPLAEKTSGGGGGGGGGGATPAAAAASSASAPPPPTPPAVESTPLSPPPGPGQGQAAVRVSKVQLYHKWISSLPGNAPPVEITPALPPAPPPPPGDPYVPPPAVLAKLLGLNPNMSKWMGISLTPLFAPPPASVSQVPPPSHPELSARVMEQSVNAAAAAAAAGGSAAAAVAAPPAPSPHKSSYFEKLNVKPTAEEVPSMFFLRPRPDGLPGHYTSQVLEEIEAALAAAKAKGEEKEATLLQHRWDVMLAAKQASLAAGEDLHTASVKAFEAGEAIKSSIAAPFVDPEEVARVREASAAASNRARLGGDRDSGGAAGGGGQHPHGPHGPLGHLSPHGPHGPTHSVVEVAAVFREEVEAGGLTMEQAEEEARKLAELNAVEAAAEKAEPGAQVRARKKELVALRKEGGFGDKEMAAAHLQKAIREAHAGRHGDHAHSLSRTAHPHLPEPLDALAFVAGAKRAHFTPFGDIGALNRAVAAMILGCKKSLSAQEFKLRRFMYDCQAEEQRIAEESNVTVDKNMFLAAQADMQRTEANFNATSKLTPLGGDKQAETFAGAFVLPGQDQLQSPVQGMPLDTALAAAIKYLTRSPGALVAQQVTLLCTLANGGGTDISTALLRSVLRPGQEALGTDALVISAAKASLKRAADVAVQFGVISLREQYAEVLEADAYAGEGLWAKAAELVHAGLERERAALLNKELKGRQMVDGLKSMAQGGGGAAVAAAAAATGRGNAPPAAPRLGEGIQTHFLQEIVPLVLYAARLELEAACSLLNKAKKSAASFWAGVRTESADHHLPGAASAAPAAAAPASEHLHANPWEGDFSPPVVPVGPSFALNEATTRGLLGALEDNKRLAEASRVHAKASRDAFSRARGLIAEAWGACMDAGLSPSDARVEASLLAGVRYFFATGQAGMALELALSLCRQLEPRCSQGLLSTHGGRYSTLVAALESGSGGAMSELAGVDATFAASVGALEAAVALCTSAAMEREEEGMRSMASRQGGGASKAAQAALESITAQAERARRERLSAEAAALAAEQALATLEAEKPAYDASLHMHANVDACLEELELMLAQPRWARLLHSGVRLLAGKRGRFPALPGASRWVDFLLANMYFDKTSPLSVSRQASCTHIFREFFLRAAPLEPTVPQGVREAAELGMASSASKLLVNNPFTPAADIIKSAMVATVLPIYLRETRQGITYVEERCLKVGLPSWTLPQIAKLCEPERKARMVWFQNTMRGWVVRLKYKRRRAAQVAAKEAAEAARALQEAEKKAARRAARAAAAAAAASYDPRASWGGSFPATAARSTLSIPPQAPAGSSSGGGGGLPLSSPAGENAAEGASASGGSGESGASGASGGEAGASPLAVVVPTALTASESTPLLAQGEQPLAQAATGSAGLPASASSVPPLQPPAPPLSLESEESEEELPTPRSKRRTAAAAVAQEGGGGGGGGGGAVALSYSSKAPPPRKKAALLPSGGSGSESGSDSSSSSSSAAPSVTTPLPQPSAEAAMAEAEEAALAEEMGEQTGTRYLAELLGSDPYEVFQQILARGGTEEEAWEAFRATERNVRLYEEAFAKATSLGVDPASLLGTDLFTVEQAITAAKAARLKAELAAAKPEEAHARASSYMQRCIRTYLARKRVGQVANRLWIPFKDATSGYYYYTSILTGQSRWTLPSYLPSSVLTLKVLCSACATALAERQCTACHEAFCGSCCDAIHAVRNLRQRHKCFRLPVAGSPGSAVRADSSPCLAVEKKSVAHAFAGTSDGICLSCEKRVGTSYCSSCEQVYCETCWPIMHARGTRATHRRTVVFKPDCNVDGSSIDFVL